MTWKNNVLEYIILLSVIFAGSTFLHVPSPPPPKSSHRAWGTVTSRSDLWTKTSSRYKAVVTSLTLSTKYTCMLIQQNIYHIPRSYFGVLYAIFREAYWCFCSKPRGFYNVVVYEDMFHSLQCFLQWYAIKQISKDNNFVNSMWFRYQIRLALPEDGVQHTKTCRRNVVNILLYKHICAFSWYI